MNRENNRYIKLKFAKDLVPFLSLAHERLEWRELRLTNRLCRMVEVWRLKETRDEKPLGLYICNSEENFR